MIWTELVFPLTAILCISILGCFALHWKWVLPVFVLGLYSVLAMVAPYFWAPWVEAPTSPRMDAPEVSVVGPPKRLMGICDCAPGECPVR